MDCLELDEEALELLSPGDCGRDPALVDLAEEDLESALEDLAEAEEAPELSVLPLLPSDLAEELDIDLVPSDLAESDLDLEPSDLAEELDLDLEPPDFAEIDLDLEPDFSEDFPEDREELGLESLFDLDEFAEDALDPTLVAMLLLSGDSSRDVDVSAASLAFAVEVKSTTSLDSFEFVDLLSSSALADDTRMESLLSSLSDLSPALSFRFSRD